MTLFSSSFGNITKYILIWLKSVNGCRSYQVAFRGNADEDDVVPDPDLLSLRPLLRGGMHRPPARLP